LSGLSSAEKADYFGSATYRIPASTNAIQKVPITFKSLSTGTGQFALLNVQVGSMNVEIPVPISGGWYQEAYIKAVNGDANDHFGRSAVISGDVLVVGAVNEDSNERTITNGTTASSNNDLVDSGAIYIYRRRIILNWIRKMFSGVELQKLYWVFMNRRIFIVQRIFMNQRIFIYPKIFMVQRIFVY
jgi:hypothetical protein